MRRERRGSKGGGESQEIKKDWREKDRRKYKSEGQGKRGNRQKKVNQ